MYLRLLTFPLELKSHLLELILSAGHWEQARYTQMIFQLFQDHIDNLEIYPLDEDHFKLLLLRGNQILEKKGIDHKNQTARLLTNHSFQMDKFYNQQV